MQRTTARRCRALEHVGAEFPTPMTTTKLRQAARITWTARLTRPARSGCWRYDTLIEPTLSARRSPPSPRSSARSGTSHDAALQAALLAAARARRSTYVALGRSRAPGRCRLPTPQRAQDKARRIGVHSSVVNEQHVLDPVGRLLEIAAGMIFLPSKKARGFAHGIIAGSAVTAAVHRSAVRAHRPWRRVPNTHLASDGTPASAAAAAYSRRPGVGAGVSRRAGPRHPLPPRPRRACRETETGSRAADPRPGRPAQGIAVRAHRQAASAPL